MNTRFRERMVGPVFRVTPDVGPVSLHPRGPRVGDGIVALALDSAASPYSPSARLDLDGLVLRIDAAVDRADGFRASVTEGVAGGLSDGAPEPIRAGFADLLYALRAGERRMYYRLFVDDPEGPSLLVIEGLKVVRGSIFRSWRQTTTLFTRVSLVSSGSENLRVLTRPDVALDEVQPIAAGVLRILPADLTRQALSMRGRVPVFLARFSRRLVFRRPPGNRSDPRR